MAYRLTYDGEILFDPYTDAVVYDAQLTAKANNPDYLDFTVPPTHPLYDEVRGRGGLVRLEWGAATLFLGEVESVETDVEGAKQVACVGALAWLGDTVVRPYSTLEGEQPLAAPSTVDGLFAWYVDQHNAHVLDGRRRFAVGVNQGWALDENNRVYRSSTQLPTTWDEISDKLLDTLGGYVSVRYDPLTVDYWADVHETNAQVIDFGVNITDFSESADTAGMYTAVRPVGKAPEKEKGAEEDPEAPTLDELPDGPTDAAGIRKLGDVVYAPEAVALYGYRECAFSDNDCTTAAGLLASAVKRLQALMAPTLSVTVKAVDLALFMEGHEHLRVGQAVRVRSAFHGVDEYLMVTSATVDLQDPGNTEYTLGAETSTLTGQQSDYLRGINGSINGALDAASAMSAEAKAAAKDAGDAARSAADAAKDAGRAVVSSTVEYASGDSPSEPPAGGWSADAPEYRAGSYVWMRTTTETADGTASTSAPALITGNDGNGVESAAVEYAAGDSGTEPPAEGWAASPPAVAGGAWLWTRTTTAYADGTSTRAYSAARQGADAVAVELATGAGSVLRNSRGATSLTATVVAGGERISDLAALRAALGESARLAWREQAPGGEAADIPEGDPRLGNDGFSLAVTADSVAGEKNFTCDLEI